MTVIDRVMALVTAGVLLALLFRAIDSILDKLTEIATILRGIRDLLGTERRPQ